MRFITHSLLLLVLLPVAFNDAAAISPLRKLVSLDDNDNNVDDLTAMVADFDFSCMMSMPATSDECSSLNAADGNSCVWCPIMASQGDAEQPGGVGACVSGNMAAMINAAGIPHFNTCGQEELSEEDEHFFDTIDACLEGGMSGDSCLAVSEECTWCVTMDDPRFGLCLTKDLIDEAKMFDDEEDPIFGAHIKCTANDKNNKADEELLEIGALADPTCATDGMPSDDIMFGGDDTLCESTIDIVGNDCISTTLMGFMPVCVTETQNGILEYLMGQMDEMGFDPLSAFGGGELLGGDAMGFGGGDGFDFGGDGFDFSGDGFDFSGGDGFDFGTGDGFDFDSLQILSEEAEEEEEVAPGADEMLKKYETTAQVINSIVEEEVEEDEEGK